MFFSSDNAVKEGSPPLLCGKVSRDIKQEVENLMCNPRVKKLRLFSECLSVSNTEILSGNFLIIQITSPHESLNCSLFALTTPAQYIHFTMVCTILESRSKTRRANENECLVFCYFFNSENCMT